ncbi:helix-turn-helix transcriptional regulator (plasmid) [Verrucomicrobiaceae bacterium 227]
MSEKADTSLISLPLGRRPVIHQAGVGEHGILREETFFRPGLWALHLYFWRGSVSFGGQDYEIRPHHIGITPPKTTLIWKFPLKPCCHFFVHFDFAGSEEDGGGVSVPVMAPLGNRHTQVSNRFESLVKWLPSNRIRAEVLLWDLLWGLTDLGQAKNPMLVTRHGAVETALGIIENELEYGLSAKALADRVAISYSQLNRLFKQHFEMTLSNYIANERFKRADHLLRETNVPIKAIAEQVGLPDLQHFNKFIRSRSGMPPRKYRALSSVPIIS